MKVTALKNNMAAKDAASKTGKRKRKLNPEMQGLEAAFTARGAGLDTSAWDWQGAPRHAYVHKKTQRRFGTAAQAADYAALDDLAREELFLARLVPDYRPSQWNVWRDAKGNAMITYTYDPDEKPYDETLIGVKDQRVFDFPSAEKAAEWIAHIRGVARDMHAQYKECLKDFAPARDRLYARAEQLRDDILRMKAPACRVKVTTDDAETLHIEIGTMEAGDDDDDEESFDDDEPETDDDDDATSIESLDDGIRTDDDDEERGEGGEGHVAAQDADGPKTLALAGAPKPAAAAGARTMCLTGQRLSVIQGLKGSDAVKTVVAHVLDKLSMSDSGLEFMKNNDDDDTIAQTVRRAKLADVFWQLVGLLTCMEFLTRKMGSEELCFKLALVKRKCMATSAKCDALHGALHELSRGTVVTLDSLLKSVDELAFQHYVAFKEERAAPGDLAFTIRDGVPHANILDENGVPVDDIEQMKLAPAPADDAYDEDDGFLEKSSDGQAQTQAQNQTQQITAAEARLFVDAWERLEDKAQLESLAPPDWRFKRFVVAAGGVGMRDVKAIQAALDSWLATLPDADRRAASQAWWRPELVSTVRALTRGDRPALLVPVDMDTL